MSLRLSAGAHTLLLPFHKRLFHVTVRDCGVALSLSPLRRSASALIILFDVRVIRTLQPCVNDYCGGPL